MKHILALLLCLPLLAHAQTALPELTSNNPGSLHYLATKNGACVWWFVDKGKFTEADQLGYEMNLYCAAASEFSKVGGRLETIIKSANPLKSLQTLPNRVPVSKIRCPGLGKCTAEDPTLADLMADLNAARRVK